MKRFQTTQPHARRTRLSMSIAGVLAGCAFAPAAGAFEFDTGNPDLALRLDTQVRYAVGVRGEEINPAFGNSPTYDETEYRFGKRQGDDESPRPADRVRRDLQGKLRFSRQRGRLARPRVPRRQGPHQPGLAGPGPAVQRDRQLHQQRLLVDHQALPLRKAANCSTPSCSATSTSAASRPTSSWASTRSTGAKPSSRVSTASRTRRPRSTASRARRAPASRPRKCSCRSTSCRPRSSCRLNGRCAASTSSSGGPTACPRAAPTSAPLTCCSPARTACSPVPPARSPRGPAVEPDRKGTNNFGVNLRYNPAKMSDTTFGVYYRKFDETQPWAPVFRLAPPSPVPRDYHLAYAKDTADGRGQRADGRRAGVGRRRADLPQEHRAEQQHRLRLVQRLGARLRGHRGRARQHAACGRQRRVPAAAHRAVGVRHADRRAGLQPPAGGHQERATCSRASATWAATRRRPPAPAASSGWATRTTAAPPRMCCCSTSASRRNGCRCIRAWTCPRPCRSATACTAMARRWAAATKARRPGRSAWRPTCGRSTSSASRWNDSKARYNTAANGVVTTTNGNAVQKQPWLAGHDVQDNVLKETHIMNDWKTLVALGRCGAAHTPTARSAAPTAAEAARLGKDLTPDRRRKGRQQGGHDSRLDRRPVLAAGGLQAGQRQQRLPLCRPVRRREADRPHDRGQHRPSTPTSSTPAAARTVQALPDDLPDRRLPDASHGVHAGLGLREHDQARDEPQAGGRCTRAWTARTRRSRSRSRRPGRRRCGTPSPPTTPSTSAATGRPGWWTPAATRRWSPRRPPCVITGNTGTTPRPSRTRCRAC